MTREQETGRLWTLGLATTILVVVQLLSGGPALADEKPVETADCPSTDAFWYRLQPAGVYIDSQRGSKAFGRSEGTILLSEDNGRTWPHKAEFADADRITFSHILNNGNIVFATGANLFLSTDNLKSYRPVTVKDRKGNDYVPHTPKNPDEPGWYFHTLMGTVSWDVDGREMMVWGNYCNVRGGAAPVNIYYSTDNGETVKIAYSFGKNPTFGDNGTPGGGLGGTPLGDADNPVICRHVHCVAYNADENAFYACTGDHTRPEGKECHWLRGEYDAQADQWQWNVLISTESNMRYKSCGMNIVDGMIYWGADANGTPPFDRGIFRCKPEDLTNPEAHELLYMPEVELGNMIVEGDVIIASHCGPATRLNTGLIVSTDRGKTWKEYDLAEFGKRTPSRFHPENTDGWFRVDLRTGWIDFADVLFIKLKK